MRFKKQTPASWDIRVLDPNMLSDEQIAYYYDKAVRDGVDEPDYPPGTTGRMTVASAYVRFCQAQLRRLTEYPKPEF